MAIEVDRSPSTEQQLAALQVEVAALADANVRAAELMAELDEARALTAALERRSEELTLQHAIDALVVDVSDERSLCQRAVDALSGVPGLELCGCSSVYLDEADRPEAGLRWLELTGANRMDVLESTFAGRRLTVAEKAPDLGPRWFCMPLAAGAMHFGFIVLCVRATPAWRERWADFLESQGRSLGRALDRMRVEARLRRTSRELELARDEALAGSRAKSQFLANMSHELRTPLNAIIGYGEMLREEAEADDNQTLLADLQRITGAGRHLMAVISNILDLSKIEEGKMELWVESFSLDAMLSSIVATVEALVARNGNTLHRSYEPGLGTAIGDEAKLRQCLLNLLANAAKFTKNGKVELAAARVGDELQFSVSDTGIGMSEDQLSRIFESFIQADASTTRRFGGTGLGLAISRQFCDMMSGKLTVRSVEGVGTQFSLTVPVALPRASRQA